jgi:tetratricopeptide (TPR) repeat protein
MMPPQISAALYDMQAQLLHVAGDYSQQLEAADRAASLARDADDQPLLCQIQMRRGNALRMLGRLDEAAGVLEEVIRMAEAAHDERTLAYALDNASGVYLLRGELGRTALYVERAYELMERLGDPLMIALLALRRGMNQYGLGEWQLAFAEFLRAHALTGELGASWVSAYTSLGLGQIYLARGETARGTDLLEQSVTLAERSGDLQALRWAQTALAEHDILEGRPESARARLEPLLDRPGLQEGLVTYLLPYLSWACLDSGDLQQAESYVSQSLERAAGERIRLAWVDALRVRALLLAQRKTGSTTPTPHAARQATAALGEATTLSEEMLFPYGKAKVAYTRGLLAQQAGQTQQARQALEEALAILNGLGERQYGERAERLLSQLG